MREKEREEGSEIRFHAASKGNSLLSAERETCEISRNGCEFLAKYLTLLQTTLESSPDRAIPVSRVYPAIRASITMPLGFLIPSI